MVLPGVPYEVICNTADKVDADFIVMGRRGLTGLKKIAIGSTSEKNSWVDQQGSNSCAINI